MNEPCCVGCDGEQDNLNWRVERTAEGSFFALQQELYLHCFWK